MEEHKVGHEETDINAKAIVTFGIILVIVAAVIHVMIWGMFHYLDVREIKADPQLSPLHPRGRQFPPEPRLQITPRNDLEAVRRGEEQILNSYGWVDEKAGVVRIPIQEAMRQIVNKEKTTKTPSHEVAQKKDIK